MQARLTLPNAITLGRLLLAPVALWVAHRGDATLYKWLFATAVASDFCDGMLARLLKAQTVLGARLDAAADTATYLVLFLAVSWLWPDFIDEHFWMLVTALVLYALNHGLSLARFRRLPAYHTWAGKAAAVLMAAGMLTWFIGGPAWPFTLALAVSMVSVVEQFAITALLPYWDANVHSLIHALRRRRATQRSA